MSSLAKIRQKLNRLENARGFLKEKIEIQINHSYFKDNFEDIIFFFSFTFFVIILNS